MIGHGSRKNVTSNLKKEKKKTKTVNRIKSQIIQMFKLADKDYKAKYIQDLKEKMIIMMEQMRKQAEKWKLLKRIKS